MKIASIGHIHIHAWVPGYEDIIRADSMVIYRSPDRKQAIESVKGCSYGRMFSESSEDWGVPAK